MNDNELGRSFQHYENYYEASKHASNPMAFHYAIAQFFYDDIEPAFTEEIDIFLWKMIKPSIVCSKRNSERRKNGGGAHAGNNYNPNGRRGKASDQEQPKPSQEKPEKNSEAPKPDAQKRKAKTFVPPTVDEVTTYAAERGFQDPVGFAEHFIAYYSEGEQKWHLSNGKPMKDWKKAVITWEPNNKYKTFGHTPGQQAQPSMYERRPDYLDD